MIIDFWAFCVVKDLSNTRQEKKSIRKNRIKQSSIIKIHNLRKNAEYEKYTDSIP